MNLLSIHAIIKRKLIKLDGKPIKTSATVKQILEEMGLEPIKQGNRFYYIESDLYETLGIDKPEED